MQVHPAQISPSESFDIFYFVRNHTDATTYYVRGVVYDLRTGEVLATHNLSQSATNARLFIKTIEAPADPNGYGRNIVAVATVYTDSSYTTKSENYEEQEAYYLVKAAPVFMGGGGSGLSARDVREIFQEEFKTALGDLPKPDKLEVPDAPDMSFVQALFGTLGAIQREINRIPKDSFDDAALSKKIDSLKDMIDERPQFEATDLSSLATSLEQVLTQLQQGHSESKVGNAQILQSIESALQRFKTEFEASIGAKVEETIQSQEITLPLSMRLGGKPKETAPADPTEGVRHLMT
jgi:hypothetical protein